MSLAGMATVSWVLLTNVVVRLLPFHCAVDVVTKPEPFTVKVNAGPPAATVEGETEVMLGVGLGGGGGEAV